MSQGGQSSAISISEAQGFAALKALSVLDTQTEVDLNNIVNLAATICNTQMSLVLLAEDGTQVLKAHVGIDLARTQKRMLLDRLANVGDDLLVITDTKLDSLFAKVVNVTGEPFIRFFASAPLIGQDGFSFGSLCVIDYSPKELSLSQREQFMRVAKLATSLLEKRLINLTEQHWSIIKKVGVEHHNNKIKQEFVSTVSHELRTPLTSISGALELVIDGVLGDVPEQMKDMLQIAYSSSQRLIDLVNDLLDLDKLTAGKMTIVPQTVDLQLLLNDACQSIKVYTDKHQIEIERSPQKPAFIRADPKRLMQVLTNLLSNACKHSSPQSIVKLNYQFNHDGQIIINVIDNGHGIPESFISHIFEKFAQADGSDTKRFAGTGLGLAICKELVNKMGGVIGFESKQGIGSHFWLRLPCDGVEKTKDKTILHLDSDTDFVKQVSENLQGLGNLLHASSLQQANRVIREHDIDLIIAEQSLQDGQLEPLVHSLHLAQQTLPIIVLSGEVVTAQLAMQVAAVIPNKFNITAPDLINGVRRILV